jgi:hypothetical protein
MALKKALTLMSIQKGFFTMRIWLLNKRAMEAKWDPIQHFLQHAF